MPSRVEIMAALAAYSLKQAALKAQSYRELPSDSESDHEEVKRVPKDEHRVKRYKSSPFTQGRPCCQKKQCSDVFLRTQVRRPVHCLH
jgi:hypothetical protein